MAPTATKTHSFQFLDADLNRQLIALLKKVKVKHRLGRDGAIYYSCEQQEQIDDLICSIRDRVFSSWKCLVCPPEWVETYKQYMHDHAVPFHEEIADGETWFFLPRKYRPLAWKLDEPAETGARRPVAASATG